MEWSKLLNGSRLNEADYEEQPHRPSYVRDLDRIVFSAPFRRLANKTQVHPLHDHDHIHHRLIHSVETGSVGRSLGMQIGHWLEQNGQIPSGGKHTVSGVVQSACLAHDIGNPPFGHSGEAAIGSWFQERFITPSGLFTEMDKILRSEFEEFEGNAQGFRIIANTEMYRGAGGMRLTKSVLGAFSKYPVSAHVKASVDENYCGTKKFGFFMSEAPVFTSVAADLGLIEQKAKSGSWWRRHPLVFLVEAADDICYNILDIEDACTAGDLSFETVKGALAPIAGSNTFLDGKSEEEQVSYLRAKGIGTAIDACVEAFKENYQDIMSGTFTSSLIESSTKAQDFQNLKDMARRQIFKAKRKTELEVSGRNVLHRVLTGVYPIYEALGKVGWDAERLQGYNPQLVRALGLELRGVTDAYSALHSLTDYVSGMTDRYTVKIARMVSGT
ncbi:dNTP triphosphohydrolase [Tabrizicola piscis]|uniref:DNTP triphosphohydrolase n=2 Tax=Tabrizicola piscis TaxID=2494374 RepID=A0A3S8UC59_9RHOB|nr:dNTP triphosphohydrolase [Tabrizicola piscis]